MSVTGYAFQNELLKAFNLSQPRDIQSGIMRVATVASLILSILGQPLRGAAGDRVADRTMLRRRIQHITEGADDVKLNALPNVFRHVCALPITEAMVRQTWEVWCLSHQPLNRCQKQRLALLALPMAEPGLEDPTASQPSLPGSQPSKPATSELVLAQACEAEARRVHYRDFSTGDLQLLLLHRDDAIADLKADKTKLKRNARSWKARADLLELRLAEKQAELDEQSTIFNWRKGQRLISNFGGYSLALRRNFSNVGAAAAAKMISEDRGGFKAKNMVIAYEHKVCVVQRLMSTTFYDTIRKASDDLVARARSDPQAEQQRCVLVMCYKGDATNSEALEKSKIHVSSLSSVSGCVPWASEPGSDPDGASCSYTKSLCDFQKVDAGTAKEFYRLAQREMHSVGAGTWEDCCKNLQSPKALGVTVFLFGLTAGTRV